jgi:hypothetical protein
MPVKTIKASQYNEAIWQCLKLYLPPHTTLSCVYRSDEDQLAIIVDRATKRGYKFGKPPSVSDASSWMNAWRMVNTMWNPVAKPGHSTHRLGIAYDLAGPDLPKIAAAIQKAASDKAVQLAPARPGWENPRLEGHCVHVEILGGETRFRAIRFCISRRVFGDGESESCPELSGALR